MASEDAAGVVLAFVEAACHAILHARGVYPAATFERRKQFGVPVHVSRHPGVTALLGDTLSAAKEAVLSGAAREVHLILLDAEGGAVEQYAFAVSAALEPPVPVTLDEATALFGGALTKLALLPTLVPPLPHGVRLDSFTLAVACDQPADAALLAGSSRVAKDAMADGRSPGEPAASAPGAPSASAARGPAATEALWLPAGPSDPETRLLPGSADASAPVQRPLKVVEAGRARVAVSWVSPP